LNDTRNGQGELEYPNGERYSRTFENDTISGFGMYSWPNGERYFGNWVNGLADGDGYHESVTYNNTFFGSYTKGVRKSGEIKWQNGDIWKGSYLLVEESSESILRESEGVMTFVESENTLQGRWTTDYSMKNGIGAMTMFVKSTNLDVKGVWIDHKFRVEKPELQNQLRNSAENQSLPLPTTEAACSVLLAQNPPTENEKAPIESIEEPSNQPTPQSNQSTLSPVLRFFFDKILLNNNII